VARRKGSISAEHGVGLHKPSYLHLQKSDNILGIYRDIKKLFDPNGILNPHKMIPEWFILKIRVFIFIIVFHLWVIFNF